MAARTENFSIYEVSFYLERFELVRATRGRAGNMARRLETLSFKDRLRVGVVQCGEGSTEILLRPFSA